MHLCRRCATLPPKRLESGNRIELVSAPDFGPLIGRCMNKQTARVAHAVFRRGNVYLKLRDELGTLYEDTAFASLFPDAGATRRSSVAAGTGHCPAVR
jgi:hypothetical protein